MIIFGSGKIIVLIISCTMKNNVVIEKRQLMSSIFWQYEKWQGFYGNI